MDIMSLFRGATPQPAATPAPATQGGPTQVANPGQPLPGTQASSATAPNGVVPTQGATGLEGITPNPAQPTSPLDTFKDIWQTPANSQGNPSPAMFANVDQAKLMDSARKVDFAKAVTPEQLQAIGAGGEGAVQAFAQAMNNVAQTVYAQSAFATTKIVDQALAKAQESFDARLPSMVKKFSVNENLQTENPLLSNPALTPLVSALSEQLVRKNPNATSSEIQQQVNDYFAALGTTFAPKAPETPASRAAARAAKQEDWSAFLGQ
jgi:hypothetical protein